MNLETSFGRWLRARRRALDLTQDDLARQVGCAIITIQKLEADERRPSRQLAERLVDTLMVAPDQRAALISLARAEPYLDPESAQAPEHQLRAPQQPPSNLPTPLTRLIGRKQDIAAVHNALLRSETRLLTLIGPPGIGKTRLSIAVAHSLQATFADGAYFVALAPISDPAAVMALIAQTLGVKEATGQAPLDQLKTVLQGKRIVLVLDNFEQVLDAAPPLAELLEACGELKALVTSRSALRVRGERLYPVPPLLLPDLARLPAIGAVARTPAVALFVERAQEVRPDFRLLDENAAAVAAICVRLDGLPLALELAAARIRLLPAEVLLARLEQRLAVLTEGARDLHPRQQTLRAAITWSYDLLDAAEQAIFARLAVFVGGCTLHAATALCNATNDLPMDVTDGMASLLDKSLLRLEAGADGEPRFLMLETIREYALERLETNGEAETMRRQHAIYYLAMAESVSSKPPLLKTLEQRAREQLEQEYANLRAALDWSQVTESTELGVRLASALWGFWVINGFWYQQHAWLKDFLLHLPRTESAALRAEMMLLAGQLQDDLAQNRSLLEESLALFQAVEDDEGSGRAFQILGGNAREAGDFLRASQLFEAALALGRKVGNNRLVAGALQALGDMAREQGDYGAAHAAFEEAVALRQELGDQWAIGGLLCGMGDLAIYEGDAAHAQALHQKAIALYQEIGDPVMVAWALRNLGRVVHLQGEHGQARALLVESLTLLHERGNPYQIGCCLDALAGVVSAQGQPEQAARLFGAGQALRADLQWPWPLGARIDYECDLSIVRTHLDAATFAAAWAEGRAMSVEQAIAYALNATVQLQPAAILHHDSDSPSTAR
jgi:predicted ATPase/DNA-binding XRE family transcriptional regulator